MNVNEQSRTIFDYMIDQIGELESEFLELKNYVKKKHLSEFYFDTSSHHFRPSPEERTCSFQGELKNAIEDLTVHSKKTLSFLQPLLRELTQTETTKVHHELHRLSTLIQECYGGIVGFSKMLSDKNGLTHLADKMKEAIHACEILEIEFSGHDLVKGDPSLISLSGSRQLLLDKVTQEVDNTLAQLPFLTSENDRDKIIKARFSEIINNL